MSAPIARRTGLLSSPVGAVPGSLRPVSRGNTNTASNKQKKINTTTASTLLNKNRFLNLGGAGGGVGGGNSGISSSVGGKAKAFGAKLHSAAVGVAATAHHHNAGFHVRLPKRMIYYTMLIFLILPVVWFVYKEAHIHRKKRTNDENNMRQRNKGERYHAYSHHTNNTSLLDQLIGSPQYDSGTKTEEDETVNNNDIKFGKPAVEQDLDSASAEVERKFASFGFGGGASAGVDFGSSAGVDFNTADGSDLDEDDNQADDEKMNQNLDQEQEDQNPLQEEESTTSNVELDKNTIYSQQDTTTTGNENLLNNNDIQNEFRQDLAELKEQQKGLDSELEQEQQQQQLHNNSNNEQIIRENQLTSIADEEATINDPDDRTNI